MLFKTQFVILSNAKNLAKSPAKSLRGILPTLRSVRMTSSQRNLNIGQLLHYLLP